MTENEVARVIVDSVIEVHRSLGGPGLLESVYEEALAYELDRRGLKIERQKAVPIFYKEKRLESSLRLDLLVDDKVIVECKAAVEHNPVFEVQALTYLRLLDLRLCVENLCGLTAFQGFAFRNLFFLLELLKPFPHA